MTAERVRVGEPAVGNARPSGGERPAPWVWLINLGMGPQFHALPAADDPGAAHPRGFEAATWPTVTGTAACRHDGRFRHGAYRHADLPRCLGCCAATGVPEGYGPRPGAPTDTISDADSDTASGNIR